MKLILSINRISYSHSIGNVLLDIYYPQFLSSDNKLYLMGFLLDLKMQVINPDENPAIAIIDIDDIRFYGLADILGA